MRSGYRGASLIGGTVHARAVQHLRQFSSLSPPPEPWVPVIPVNIRHGFGIWLPNYLTIVGALARPQIKHDAGDDADMAQHSTAQHRHSTQYDAISVAAVLSLGLEDTRYLLLRPASCVLPPLCILLPRGLIEQANDSLSQHTQTLTQQLSMLASGHLSPQAKHAAY